MRLLWLQAHAQILTILIDFMACGRLSIIDKIDKYGAIRHHEQLRPAGGNGAVNRGHRGFVRGILPISNDSNLVTLSAQRYVVFCA